MVKNRSFKHSKMKRMKRTLAVVRIAQIMFFISVLMWLYIFIFRQANVETDTHEDSIQRNEDSKMDKHTSNKHAVDTNKYADGTDDTKTHSNVTHNVNKRLNRTGGGAKKKEPFPRALHPNELAKAEELLEKMYKDAIRADEKDEDMVEDLEDRVDAAEDESVYLDNFKTEDTVKYQQHVLKSGDYQTFWKHLNNLVGRNTLYPSLLNVSSVLEVIRTARVTYADVFDVRSSFKILLYLEGGQFLLFKPFLVLKKKNQKSCNKGCEQPASEIISFHINRLLDMRSMPFTASRQISWHDELEAVAADDLRKMMTVKENGDVCFRWDCMFENVKTYCFDNGTMRGSVMYWLPNEVKHFLNHMNNDSVFHAWSPTSDNKEYKDFVYYLPGEDNFCSEFARRYPYTEDRWLVDIIDMGIMDFLVSNYDSKHTYMVNKYGKPWMSVMLDYGHAFCTHSDLYLAASLYQCCKIRKRTYEAMKVLQEVLPQKLENAVKLELFADALSTKRMNEIHKRLKKLILLVQFCILEYGYDDVIIPV